MKILFYVDSLAAVSHCTAVAEAIHEQMGAHIIFMVVDSNHCGEGVTRKYKVYDYSILTKSPTEIERCTSTGKRKARFHDFHRSMLPRRYRRVMTRLWAAVIEASGWLRAHRRRLTSWIGSSSSEMLRIFVYSRGVDRFLREIGPDVIILPELNVGTLSTIFVAKGKRNGVPTVVVPFTIPNPTEPAAYYGNDPLHRADRPLGRVLGRLYPRWRFEHEGKKLLRLPPLVAATLEIMGFSTPAPWILNRGDAAAIALDSEAQRDFYLHLGFPRDQLKVTGDLNYCVPFRDDSEKQELVNELCRRQGLRRGLPLLVCGFPPDQYSSTNTQDFEFSSYASLIEAWIASFRMIGGKANILIRPHPRVSPDLLRVFETPNIKISIEPTASLIPLCDLYVASISATIRWAISSGVPVLNYDTYRLRYTDFDAVPGVLPIDNVSKFQSTLTRFIDDPVFAAEITNHQRSVMKYWGFADGKSAERFAALIKDVVNRTTQQPFSILRSRPSHRHSNRASFSN